jgi:hypothetical protein
MLPICGAGEHVSGVERGPPWGAERSNHRPSHGLLASVLLASARLATVIVFSAFRLVFGELLGLLTASLGSTAFAFAFLDERLQVWRKL